MLRRLQSLYLSSRNSLDYALRQFFRWRRSGLNQHNESKAGLYAALPDNQRAQAETVATRLLQEYRLDLFYRRSAADNYCENLFYLNLLEEALQNSGVVLPADVSVADIGPSTWFYVQGLYAGLKWWRFPAGRKVQLTGYEGDAYRVYADYYSRYDHALANLKGLENATYEPVAFQPHPAKFDLILMLFPFVFLEDHLKWGLPRSMFEPQVLLQAAWSSLKPSGYLVIVNQGEAEHKTQRKMLEMNNIQVSTSFCFETLLYQYDIPRYCIVVQRHAAP
jgi:SAM-dependent methyltransferase